jgi:hypothetical protein
VYGTAVSCGIDMEPVFRGEHDLFMVLTNDLPHIFIPLEGHVTD